MPSDRDRESTFLKHAPCPSCGSKDNLGVYDDHSFCFGCGYFEGTPTEGDKPTDKQRSGLISLEYRPLNKRKLKEDTCRKWGYGVGNYKGQTVQVANYRDLDGKVVGQKLRFPGKKFSILGDTREVPKLLYGGHLWPAGGKMLVVCEGELDALSINQAQGLKWPVVSVSSGAAAAVKCVSHNLEYVESFESVVFLFDQDEPGQEAARACAELLSPGKAKIAALPMKDASDMLVADKGAEILNAIFRARTHRPDGLVFGDDPELWEKIKTRESFASTPYPWQAVNEKLHGMRAYEMVVLCSGTGIGKSSICRELAYHLLTVNPDENVGYIALEESVERSCLGIMGVSIDSPLHLDHVFKATSEEDLRRAYDATVGTGRVVLYDHFGSMENDRLLNKIRQMIKGCNVKTVFLDHLSIVVSALDGGDERRRIDAVCTKLRQLVEENGIRLFLVSHLRRGEGKPLEEGGVTSLNLLRGSAAIAQLADAVIGLERNQQGDNPNVTTVRVLKNRYSGDTGLAGWLEYKKDTGRLVETTLVTPEPEEHDDF